MHVLAKRSYNPQSKLRDRSIHIWQKDRHILNIEEAPKLFKFFLPSKPPKPQACMIFLQLFIECIFLPHVKCRAQYQSNDIYIYILYTYIIYVYYNILNKHRWAVTYYAGKVQLSDLHPHMSTQNTWCCVCTNLTAGAPNYTILDVYDIYI